jgi:hypothetical protein
MGLISRAWTKLAPPGAMSVDLTRQRVGMSVILVHDVSEHDLLWVNRVVLAAVRPLRVYPDNRKL